MNNRAFTISFVVALMAVLMVHQYVTSTEETYRLKFGVEMSVVTASKDIEELAILDKTNLIIKTVPKQFLEPGVGSKIEDFEGGLAIAPIMKGEQITRTKVTMLGTRTGLSRQVAVGKRAVTITVDDSRAVSRLIKPGDRVDVLAVLNYGKGEVDKIEAKTVLQDVIVLATGKLIANTVPGIIEHDYTKKDKKPEKTNLTEYTTYSSVTLEVDPYDAQKIIFMQKELGGVFLSLRHNDDNMHEELENITFADILGVDSKRSKNAAESAQEAARRQSLQQQLQRQGGVGNPAASPGGGGR